MPPKPAPSDVWNRCGWRTQAGRMRKNGHHKSQTPHAQGHAAALQPQQHTRLYSYKHAHTLTQTRSHVHARTRSAAMDRGGNWDRMAGS